MTICALGYLGFGGADLASWEPYAQDFLGFAVAERSASSLALRMDDRAQRLFLDADLEFGERVFGWELADADGLEQLAARLDRAHVPIRNEPASLADRRAVSGLISFADPMGNRLEAFYGARQAATPFTPGRAVSGFRTGALGMGHAVITDPDIERALPFYRDVLGFGLSDYVLSPFKGWFFHVNGRHHSIALIQSRMSGLHHFMVEHWSLDDVGQGYDLALARPETIGQTLGRHTNDFMTSFYAKTPSGFMVEVGWGGRVIDPSTWQAVEMTDGPSLWGHDRHWLPPEDRARSRETVLDVGRRGVRQAVQVIEGNHVRMPGKTPWVD